MYGTVLTLGLLATANAAAILPRDVASLSLSTPVDAADKSGATTIRLDHSWIDYPLSSNSSIECLNCTIWGDLEVTAGDFKFETGQKTGFTSGDFAARAKGLGGYFLFGVDSPSFTQTYPIPYNPQVASFNIDGVGTIDVDLAFAINLSLNEDAAGDLEFGFEFSVPDGAVVDVDIADTSRSTTHGFSANDDGVVVTALPFSRGVDGSLLSANVGLHTTILFSLSNFTYDGLDIVANAGVFLDLPKLSLNGTLVPESQCPTANATSPNDLVLSAETQFSSDLGVQAMAELAGGKRAPWSKLYSSELSSSTKPVKKTCVAF